MSVAGRQDFRLGLCIKRAVGIGRADLVGADLAHRIARRRQKLLFETAAQALALRDGGDGADGADAAFTPCCKAPCPAPPLVAKCRLDDVWRI
jgi:hypothetical protein